MDILPIDNTPDSGSDDVAVESVTVRYIQRTDCAEEKGYITVNKKSNKNYS